MLEVLQVAHPVLRLVISGYCASILPQISICISAE